MVKRISVIFGTRPEAIKLARGVLAYKARKDFDCRPCAEAQGRPARACKP
jgi:UDP-N-acetylglucosamine 2-epimerase